MTGTTSMLASWMLQVIGLYRYTPKIYMCNKYTHYGNTPLAVILGRIAEVEGLSTADCSGLCARGHFCPAGSTSAFQEPCPAGKFGAVRGLVDGFCVQVTLTQRGRRINISNNYGERYPSRSNSFCVASQGREEPESF